MRCPEVRDLLQPFLDGELEVEQNVTILKHLEMCPGCCAKHRDMDQLRDVVARATRESVPADMRERILTGAFAQEDAGLAPVTPMRRSRRWLLATAASVLVSVGLGGSYLAHADPFCWWNCPTFDAVARAHHTSVADQPLSVSDLAERLGHAVQAPDLAGFTLVGGNAFADEDATPRPMVTYCCDHNSAVHVTYVRLPHGHDHMGAQRELTDGRVYRYGQMGGMGFVSWEDADGVLNCCVGEEGAPAERLFAMAAALRASES